MEKKSLQDQINQFGGHRQKQALRPGPANTEGYNLTCPPFYFASDKPIFKCQNTTPGLLDVSQFVKI